MNPAIRRFFALVVVFIVAFLAVAALRNWRAGGDWRSLLPGFPAASGQFRPEEFTLPESAPLALGDVELLSRLNDEYARLTAAVVPSVVSIDTTGIRSEPLMDLWGRTRMRDYPTQGQGSGVIVTREGHVVTNHHVVAGQQKIQVTLHGGKTYAANLVGEDTLLDIAVLKIVSNEEFIPLKIGDSSQAKVGQIVMAIGNPFGLGETVTQGIISAKERSLSDNQRDLFQTDAAINPGNSGGPLVNLQGEIIGINVAIFSPDRQNPGFQGVGFSIPSNDVKETLFQILERGRPVRGFLGVQLRDLNPTIRSALGYPDDFGAVVAVVVPGSPAETAGLQGWDVVRAVNGEKITSAAQFLSRIQRTRVGEAVSLDIWRDGATMQLQANIAESGAPSPAAQFPADPTQPDKALQPDQALRSLGVQVRDLSVSERMRGYRGVVVTEVSARGLARKLLKSGDLVIGVNNSRVGGAEDFALYLAASAGTDETVLHVVRDGQILRITVPILTAEN